MRYLLGLLLMLLAAASPASAQRAFSGGDPIPTAQRSNADLQKGCNAGVAVDCSDLGERILDQNPDRPDYKKAVPYFQKGCDGDDNWACTRLVVLYGEGHGVKQDLKAAARYAEKACDLGSRMGCGLIGAVYEDGEAGYPKDAAKAAALFSEACFGNANLDASVDEIAQLFCPALAKLTAKPACQIFTDTKTNKEVKACFQEGRANWQLTVLAPVAPVAPVAAIPAVAAARQPAVQQQGASTIPFSKQVFGNKRMPTDSHVQMFVRLCDQGDNDACAIVSGGFFYGFIHASGNMPRVEIAKDYDVSGPYAQWACKNGSASGCTLFGLHDADGRGVDQDFTIAIAAFEKACKLGDEEMCNQLRSVGK